jgi:6,7-dimethyl-8-ribityllumazine synthase
MTSSDETVFGPLGRETHAARVGANVHGNQRGLGLRIGIACGEFNGGITNRLLEGALEGLEQAGVAKNDITVAWAPGAFELPLVAQTFASRGRDAVICLGAVIRGDTPHFDYVAGECARGLTNVQLATNVPTIFGVLTVNTVEQALERCAPGVTNKGFEAATTAVAMVSLLRHPSMD